MDKISEQFMLLESLILESRISDFKEKYSEFERIGVVDDVVAADPTKNKKYLAWIGKFLSRELDFSIKRYMASQADDDRRYWKSIIAQYIDKVQHVLEDFERYAAKMPKEERDINHWRHINDLRDAIDDIKAVSFDNDVVGRREVPEGEGKIVIDNEDFFIVRPEDVEASCYYGKRTRGKWCISDPDQADTYWEKYVYDECTVFYFLIFNRSLFKNAPKESPYRDSLTYGKIAIPVDTVDGKIDDREHRGIRNAQNKPLGGGEGSQNASRDIEVLAALFSALGLKWDAERLIGELVQHAVANPLPCDEDGGRLSYDTLSMEAERLSGGDIYVEVDKYDNSFSADFEASFYFNWNDDVYAINNKVSDVYGAFANVLAENLAHVFNLDYGMVDLFYEVEDGHAKGNLRHSQEITGEGQIEEAYGAISSDHYYVERYMNDASDGGFFADLVDAGILADQRAKLNGSDDPEKFEYENIEIVESNKNEDVAKIIMPFKMQFPLIRLGIKTYEQYVALVNAMNSEIATNLRDPSLSMRASLGKLLEAGTISPRIVPFAYYETRDSTGEYHRQIYQHYFSPSNTLITYVVAAVRFNGNDMATTLQIIDKQIYPKLYAKVYEEMEQRVKSYAAADRGTLLEDNMIQREAFIAELKLRDTIKAIINEVADGRENERAAQIDALRDYIRSVIMEEDTMMTSELEHLLEVADTPHRSTGINVLEDLLKKIVPILEDDYKQLTTDKEQRDSYRAHIINAVQNSLAPSKLNVKAPDAPPIPEPTDEPAMDQQLDEEDLTVRVDSDGDGTIGEPAADADKFIDIDDKKAKQDDPIPDDVEDTFTIPDEEETGRNFAARTFDKVEKQIVDAFNLLASDEDRDVFYDYLITNLKLYFDKFEDELDVDIEEPADQVSDEFEQNAL